MSNKSIYMVVVGTDTTLGFVKAPSTAGAKSIAEGRWSRDQLNDYRYAVHYVCKDFTYESQFDAKGAVQRAPLGFRGGLTSQE